MGAKELDTTAAAGAFLKRYADWIMGLGVLGLVVTLITPVSPIRTQAECSRTRPLRTARKRSSASTTLV